MILKSFELNKIKFENYNFYLFYGDNEGFKEEIIKSFFEKQYQGNVYRYDEKEVLDNVDSFYNSILTKSFFDNKKLIIINRVSDKIRVIVEELIEKKTEDIQFILNSKNLEKKSILRKFFEKEKSIICVPFYEDNNQTLNSIVSQFFRNKKIPISQQLINVLTERSRGSSLPNNSWKRLSDAAFCAEISPLLFSGRQHRLLDIEQICVGAPPGVPDFSQSVSSQIPSFDFTCEWVPNF